MNVVVTIDEKGLARVFGLDFSIYDWITVFFGYNLGLDPGRVHFLLDDSGTVLDSLALG